MNFLILDVETNGLRSKGSLPYTLGDSLQQTDFTGTPEHWPRIVEIAWQVVSVQLNTFVDTDTQRTVKLHSTAVVHQLDTLIKPKSFDIPQSAINVHGITKAMAMTEGVDIKAVLIELMRICRNVDYIVCHNAVFDTNVVFGELHRANMFIELNRFMMMPTLCTMELSKIITGSKLSLSKLYLHTFGRTFEGSHRAKGDVAATAEILSHWVQNRHLDNYLCNQ